MAVTKQVVEYDDNGNQVLYDIGALASNIVCDTNHRFVTDTQISNWDSKANGEHSHTTVNGHTVESDVPANAKFTDTIYNHPNTPGNKHIPSGGSSGQILRWVSDGVAEWSDEIDTTYEPATEEKDGLMTKEHVKSLNDKANKSKTVNTVLSVSDWVGEGPVTITLSVEGVTDDNNVEVFVANNATDEEVEAWMSVAIMTGSQSTNTITLKGYGSKPDIDIPITLIIRAD